MIALSVMYIPNCMIFYFCITWLPTYLLERHGFNISGMALFAGLPLLVSMPGDLLGGWLTDRLSSRYGLRVGRCGLGAVAYLGVGVVGGTMNSTGNLVAMLNPRIVAYSVEWFASWDVPLYVMGGLFLVGAACWTISDPRRPVFE
jgi:MFS transporter, ACS family, glucarate transporter